MVNHYKIQSGVKHAKTTLSRAKTVTALGVAGLLSAIALPLAAHAATTSTVVVSPTNNQGWVFNPDPTNFTPYEFSNKAHSIGAGSVFALPIGSTPDAKFIAEKTIAKPVLDVKSISSDFKIAGNGTPASANQFYMNVYANFGESSPTKYYDCRYDVVATVGSTANFSTITYDASVAYPVSQRGSSPKTCPPTIAGMQALSAPNTKAVVRAVTLNIGDTSSSDVGLAGYYDNVVIKLANDQTTYDFELANTPKNKEDCKKGGFVNFTDANGEVFKNQGSCVSASNQLKEQNGEMSNVRETENRNEVENN